MRSPGTRSTLAIVVSFPSPATLNMTNIADQLQTVEANAESISNVMVPPKLDQSSEQERIMFKMKVIREFMPSIDWDLMEELKAKNKLDLEKDKIENPPIEPTDPTNIPY